MTDFKLDFRNATIDDLETIVQMLADDPLGAQRERFEDPLLPSYLKAFKCISTDPNNELVVVTTDNQIAGFLQITFIPYLTYQGRWRALVEGVRVKKKYRGQGIGKSMFQWAIARAKAKNCHLFQLTTDKQRPDAIKFYKALGFVASHEGMKLYLP